MSARRTERGAAAVETALLSAFLLVPFLLGIIYYGTFFWRAQSVPVLDANIDQSGIVGNFCAGPLLDRVKQTALIAVQNVDAGSGLPVQLSNITATVVNSLPGLGVDVLVTVNSPVLNQATSLLPLPNGGNVTSDTLIRLQNVHLSTTGCT